MKGLDSMYKGLTVMDGFREIRFLRVVKRVGGGRRYKVEKGGAFFRWVKEVHPFSSRKIFKGNLQIVPSRQVTLSS